jgi:hypothetical protein
MENKLGQMSLTLFPVWQQQLHREKNYFSTPIIDPQWDKI